MTHTKLHIIGNQCVEGVGAVWNLCGQCSLLCVLHVLMTIILCGVGMQNSSPEWPAPAMGSSVVVWPPWPSQWLEEDRLEALVLLASEYQPWVCSVVAALAVGLAGVVPLLFLPTDHQAKTSSGE